MILEVPMKPYSIDREVARFETSADVYGLITRRGVFGRLSAVLAGNLVALGLLSGAVEAKRKKKKQKKNVEKPLKPSDWDGFWNTRLSNGVSGTANLSYDTSIDLL